jgi:hypothetical protein
VSGSPAPLVGRTRLFDVGEHDDLILPDPSHATASRRIPCEIDFSPERPIAPANPGAAERNA